MCEQNKTLYFEASYTLDVICFLDLLFSDSVVREEEMVKQFEELLSPQAPLTLKKARKGIPKGESFASMLIPLLTVDPEFNHLRVTDLLASPKYLITLLKKQNSFKSLSKDYQKFINRQAEMVMTQIGLLITELEKAKFKPYWLESRLPLINLTIKQYEKDIRPFKCIETLNDWFRPVRIEQCYVYILSFYEGKILSLLNCNLVVSTKSSSSQVIQSSVDQRIATLNLEKKLKSYMKKYKSQADVNQAFQAVKGEYKTLSHYVEGNLKLALMTKLYQEFNVIDQSYQYLGRYNFGTHKISVLFYHYMSQQPKAPMEELEIYLLKVIQKVNLEEIEHRYLMIMNQQL